MYWLKCFTSPAKNNLSLTGVAIVSKSFPELPTLTYEYAILTNGSFAQSLMT